MAQMMKQECEKDTNESQLAETIMSSQSSAALSLSAQAYQQVLQQTTGAGNLAPQLQFFQAPSNSTTPLQLPWMMPPYQMMVLPQGMSQSLFAPNVLALQDSHILVAPLGDANNGQQGDDGLLQTTAEGLVRQTKDPTDKRSSGASPAQPRLTTVAVGAGAGDAHSSIHGGANMMTVGQHIVTDGSTFNAHLANTSVETVLGRHRQMQVDMAKPDVPKPPKKPLTPYMLFSKAIWPQVKAANSHLSSVCEIGAVVGALWRDLNPNEKQRYNEQFAKDKERYDTELRVYLNTTGLHASDLVKPKQKRKDIRDKSSRSASSTLNAPGQQVVQTLMGMSAPALDVQRQAGAVAAAAGLPNLSQDWTGQAVHQFASQQVLAQMGLAAGQTLYANSDGSISVDGSNVGNLVAFHPQSLQVVSGASGQIVSGTGGHIAAIYSDQRHGGLAQTSTSKSDNSTASHTETSRQWSSQSSQVGQDGRVVLYQTSATGDQGKTEMSQRSQAAMKTVQIVNKQGTDGAINGPVVGQSQDHQTQYYGIDQLGQIVVKREDDASRESRLETELQHLRSALSEKTCEVQSLNHKLEEAYRIIERYKQQFSDLPLSQPPAGPGVSGQSDGHVSDGIGTDSVSAPTTTVNSTSG